MGREPEQAFFQRRHTDGQQTNEKMLSITNHQENANQNQSETLSHTCEKWLLLKRQQINCWIRMGRRGNPCAILMEM